MKKYVIDVALSFFMTIVFFSAFLAPILFLGSNISEKYCYVVTKHINNDIFNTRSVITSDCGSLVVQDTNAEMQLNSKEIFNKIEAGKKYRFILKGSSIPWLEIFPNIIYVDK